MNAKLFIDADVLLDVAIDRQPHSPPAGQLLALVEQGVYVGHTSAVTAANLYYILRKHFDGKRAVNILKKLRLLVKFLAVDDVIIGKALESGFSDFEDALQYFTAVQNHLDYIITRNTADYRRSTIPVHTPQEFLSLQQIIQR